MELRFPRLILNGRLKSKFEESVTNLFLIQQIDESILKQNYYESVARF